MARLPNMSAAKFLAVPCYGRIGHVQPGEERNGRGRLPRLGEGRDGRWELRDGQPVRMPQERAAHALTKLSAHIALINGVQRAGLRWRVFPDSMTVRIAARTAFELDGLPAPIDLNTMEIPNPVVVVEVLSPSTAADDHRLKVDGWLSLASVEHYLILDPDRRVLIHHKRGQAGAIETRILRDGLIRFDPPGFEAEVAAFFVAD
jgi:Uma2 family endonuclease